MLGQRLEVSIVEEMLDYDEILKANYTLYQALLRAITSRDFITLESILRERSNS